MRSDELRRLIQESAGRTGFGQSLLEKDCYISRLLEAVDEAFGDRLILKGGTLLAKVYLGYRRLSEDVDYVFNFGGNSPSRKERSRLIEPVRQQVRGVCEAAGLKLESPRGRGFNESTQYVFETAYPSTVSGREEAIKIEVSIRHGLSAAPVRKTASHMFQDAVTGEDVLPRAKVWCLSYKEAVAEKVRAAVTREAPVIRDFYDLGAVLAAGFRFDDASFRRLLREKLGQQPRRRHLGADLRFSKEEIAILERQVEADLMPLLRSGERFDLAGTLRRLEPILAYACRREMP